MRQQHPRAGAQGAYRDLRTTSFDGQRKEREIRVSEGHDWAEATSVSPWLRLLATLRVVCCEIYQSEAVSGSLHQGS